MANNKHTKSLGPKIRQFSKGYVTTVSRIWVVIFLFFASFLLTTFYAAIDCPVLILGYLVYTGTWYHLGHCHFSNILDLVFIWDVSVVPGYPGITTFDTF